MRKNILGLAAIAIAISASAFTAPSTKSHGKLVSYKWFRITANRTTSQAVPSAGATFINEGEAPSDISNCPTSTLQCVSGFNASQVNSSNQLNGTQMPQVVAATRN
jgi:hypothetical protein